jgi:hypothetical protein
MGEISAATMTVPVAPPAPASVCLMSRLHFAAIVCITPLALLGCATPTALTATDEHGAAVAIRQKWHGNALVVDLHDVTGRGDLILKCPNAPWPKHLVIRVTPGAVHEVLVRTEAGMLFTPVADTDAKPRDIPLQSSPALDPKSKSIGNERSQDPRRAVSLDGPSI